MISVIPPEVHYVRSGDYFVAYETIGEGAVDLVFVAEFWHSIEAQWDEPSFSAFLQGLASFSRLICFDQRGSGLSDPVPNDALPSLEVWMDDVRAVMDAVGSRRAVLLASGGGSTMALTFAAMHPEKVQALVVMNGTARFAAGPGYDFGSSPEFEDRVRRETEEGWGRGVLVDIAAPSRVDDDAFRAWWARYQRLGTSPGTQLAQRRMLLQLDVRHVLPAVRVPTLVVHRSGNRLVPIEHGRFLASHIAGARLVEVPGDDYFLWTDAGDDVVEEIRAFVVGSPESADHDRVLTTVLFADITGSTERVARMGDRAWRDLLATFQAAVRWELSRFRGHEVDTAGDGFLATFDGPARAIRCALAIEATTRALGIEVHSGLHTGEVERIGDRVSGLAVHIGSRIADVADAGEVLVSSTVRDLVAGSSIELADRGEHALKGIPEPWRLYAASVRAGDDEP